LEKKHDISAITAEFQAELDSLRARKRGKMDFRSRCIAAGRSYEYSTIYALVCLDAHNNVAALIDRHVNTDESVRAEVNAFGDGNPLGLASRVSFAIGWMLQSAQFVHGAFRSEHTGIAELQREHEP
jgi:hypothetical protein